MKALRADFYARTVLEVAQDLIGCTVEHQGAAGWGAYAVDEIAIKHGAGFEEETTDPKRAYALFPKFEPTRYRDEWLPVS